jgi:hypothetical protein
VSKSNIIKLVKRVRPTEYEALFQTLQFRNLDIIKLFKTIATNIPKIPNTNQIRPTIVTTRESMPILFNLSG